MSRGPFFIRRTFFYAALWSFLLGVHLKGIIGKYKIKSKTIPKIIITVNNCDIYSEYGTLDLQSMTKFIAKRQKTALCLTPQAI